MTKFRNALHNEKGFTLIELLVVVIIIGILAAVALPNLMGASDSAREKRVQADLRTISTGIETYYSENGEYPADQAAFEALDEFSKTTLEDPWDDKYGYTADGTSYDVISTTVTNAGTRIENGKLVIVD